MVVLIGLAGSPASAAPLLTPPSADRVTDPPYPEDGQGDARVVLLMTINKDGTVRSAEVQSGAEPFASAAQAAATAWLFQPATRDGAAVAAKIRYEVSFIQPPPPELAIDVPIAEGEPQPGTLDVLVKGVKHPPSVSSLSRAEVRALPGAFGDPFRAIEVLPGVTPIVSGLPFFYVRGAPPGNIGYFVDGVRVPYLFHAGAGPSVVHPAIIERVDLYAGGYPARHGRYAGAIVAAETTPPRTDWHGEGVIRLVDAGALVEGGFAGGRGTALVAGRYSYTAAVFSLLSPDTTLDYRDYQARVSFDLTERDRISLFAFGAYDYLADSSGDIETVLFGSEFYRVDTRYDVRFPDGGSMRAAVTWGFDQTRVADGRNTQNVLAGSRVELRKPIGTSLTLRGGLDVQHDNYTSDGQPYVDPDDPETEEYNDLFPPRADGAAGAWLELAWKPTPDFTVTPGIRIDMFSSNGVHAVSADPRLAVVAKLHERVRVLHALGVAHQPPSFVVPVPGLAIASLKGGLQRSFQAASGIEVDLPWATTATVTAFDSVFLNMTDTIGVQAPDRLTQIPRSLGGAKGVEIYLRRSLSKRIGGFVSYTFSRTTRSVGGATFPAAFDRSHVFNAAFGVNLGRGWQTGTRLSLYSGAPNLSAPVQLGASDPPRDPLFYRLDLRLEKKWRIADTAWISGVLEMLNATLNTETIKGGEIGPVSIPSIGVEAGF